MIYFFKLQVFVHLEYWGQNMEALGTKQKCQNLFKLCLVNCANCDYRNLNSMISIFKGVNVIFYPIYQDIFDSHNYPYIICDITY